MTDLVSAARALFAEGKGILAEDESTATATKRLAEHGISASARTRKQYHELFLNAEGIEQYISGAILFDETFRQKESDGNYFPVSLAARGIAPGIKVDQGVEPFPESSDEFITNGLIGLPERLSEYKKIGAVFTKWRAVIRIQGTHLPTAAAIIENSKRLAQYAKSAQEAGLVPIVEPEVLLDGMHSRTRARSVVEEALGTLFSVLAEQSVDKASIILKTSMALSGSGTPKRDTPNEVAEDTLAALIACVPKQIAGVAFLSGGQTPDQATDNLSAIRSLARKKSVPWPLTFSFDRALREEGVAIWRGKEENIPAARAAFLSRLAKVSAAVS